MTDGDVPAREPAGSTALNPGAGQPGVLAVNLPGQVAIVEFLRLHASVSQRSSIGRLFGVSPLTAETRVWYDAALSEIEVGAALARLGTEWTVLHALPVGAGALDIDHVAIGPAGVFIINTKSHPGQVVWASQRSFLVGGIRHPYIRNMEYEIGRAERLLGAAASCPVEVTGVLAVVAAKSITVREPHRDVVVLPVAGLVTWLLRLPVTMSPGKVAEVGRTAALQSTWHQNGVAVRDREELRERFAAARSEVRRAWRLQLLWASTATVIGGGGFIFVTYSILFNALLSISAD